jgi:hypothetical protein
VLTAVIWPVAVDRVRPREAVDEDLARSGVGDVREEPQAHQNRELLAGELG